MTLNTSLRFKGKSILLYHHHDLLAASLTLIINSPGSGLLDLDQGMTRHGRDQRIKGLIRINTLHVVDVGTAVQERITRQAEFIATLPPAVKDHDRIGPNARYDFRF